MHHLLKMNQDPKQNVERNARNLHRASLFFCCKQPVKHFQDHLSCVVATTTLKGAFPPPTVLECDQSFGFTFNAIFDWSLRSPSGKGFLTASCSVSQWARRVWSRDLMDYLFVEKVGFRSPCKSILNVVWVSRHRKMLTTQPHLNG